jgi:ATP-dependent DNA helicase RecQ
MQTAERHQIQERFMQGELDVVVATAAFGMGVDKSSIRFVLHYDHPASLEAYTLANNRLQRLILSCAIRSKCKLLLFALLPLYSHT